MTIRTAVAVLAVSGVLVMTAGACSSGSSSTDTDTASAAGSSSVSTSAAAPTPTCPVAFTGANPTRAEVEADFGALAAEGNAINSQFVEALGPIAPAPTAVTLSDVQAQILAAAPAGALEKVSSGLCGDPTLSAGFAQRADAAVAAAVPDSTPQASEIRQAIAVMTLDHPISLLLSTAFSVCAVGTDSSAELTRETNPLAADRGAITIVNAFCPQQASLFDPVS